MTTLYKLDALKLFKLMVYLVGEREQKVEITCFDKCWNNFNKSYWFFSKTQMTKQRNFLLIFFYFGKKTR